MDIEKAIEILEDILKEGRGLSGPDRFTAIRLGIEALLAYKKSQAAG